jgi:hypothetical protein
MFLNGPVLGCRFSLKSTIKKPDLSGFRMFTVMDKMDKKFVYQDIGSNESHTQIVVFDLNTKLVNILSAKVCNSQHICFN